MNSKKLAIPAIATLFLALSIMMSAAPAYAVLTATIGPKLDVVTIPEDNQVLKTGVIVLGISDLREGITPTPEAITPLQQIGGFTPGSKFVSQFKLLVTYNGLPLFWSVGFAGVTVACNVIEKDKSSPVPDKLGNGGSQFDEEQLITTLVDVSDLFVCKPRFKSPAPGLLESTGVLDVYFVGDCTKITCSNFIADNILVVEAFFTVGRTVVFGTEFQDVCVLGYSFADPFHQSLTLPDGSHYDNFANPFGPFVSCEAAALVQRDILHVPIAPLVG
jgi:hypothetical protein